MSIDSLVRKGLAKGLGSSFAAGRRIFRKPLLYSALAVGLACGGSGSRSNPVISLTDAAADAATDASSDGSRYDGPRRMGKIEGDMQVSGKDMSSGVGNDLGTDMYSPRGDAYSRDDAGVDKAADASYDSGAENDLGAERIDAARADEGLRARTDGPVRADAGILADGGYFSDASTGADLGGDAAPDAAPCLRSLYFFDGDGDGYGNVRQFTLACEQPEDYVENALDCNDNDETRWREIPAYRDDDRDSFGSGALNFFCLGDELPEGYALNNADCNDRDGSIFPDAREYCDGINNDCSILTADGSGEAAPLNSLQAGVCLSSQQICSDGSWTENYASVSAYEAGIESICDRLDNNCNGSSDEGLSGRFYADNDRDGFGNPAVFTDACSLPEGYAGNAEDCNDGISSIHPGAFEYCNTLDDNCDGSIDEGYALSDACDNGLLGECSRSGEYRCSADGLREECSAPAVERSVEECNGLDNDCDGVADNNLTALSQDCFAGIGECRRAGLEYQVCEGVAGWSADYRNCDAVAGVPGGEICDGLDNDCDGTADNNLTALSQECFTGIGECRRGGLEYQVCEGAAGWSADYRNCDAVAGEPGEEVRDGLDNDCNGIIDDTAWGQVSAGLFHTCAVRNDGLAQCWGENEFGQRDDIPEGNFVAVTAGAYHSCGLRIDGSAECWGRNNLGQSDAPPGTYTQLDAGYNFNCGLRSDGTVDCWGDNSNGQSSNEPAGRFRQVSAGASHGCAVREDRAVECWGNNINGQAPPLVARNFSQVSGGFQNSCGLTSEGIECWGRDRQVTSRPGLYSLVSSDYDYNCSLDLDGFISCWGEGEGVGGMLSPEGNFTQLDVGVYHSCAITLDGLIDCWGRAYGP